MFGGIPGAGGRPGGAYTYAGGPGAGGGAGSKQQRGKRPPRKGFRFPRYGKKGAVRPDAQKGV